MISKTKSIFFVLIFLGLTPTTLSAQTLKIALVDFQVIASKMPEMATIEHEVKAEFKEQIEYLEKLSADAKFNYDKLQREGATLGNEEREGLRKTIIFQQEDLDKKSKPLQAAMLRRGQELQNRILSKIQQALEMVSQSENYDFVFHKESLAYTPHAYVDISSKVLEKAKTL